MAFRSLIAPAALLAAALSLSPAAQAQGAPKADPSREAAAPAPAAPRKPAAADPVQEKFRRFQKEMGSPGQGAQAFGDPGPEALAEEAPAQPGLLSLGLQIVFGLVFVVVLAVVSIRLLKRFQGRLRARPGSATSGDLLEVLETCHLGTQQRVVALRINDEVGVVGVTAQGITLLTMLKQPAEEIRQRRMASGNPAAFSESLNKLLDRFKKPKRVSDLLEDQ